MNSFPSSSILLTSSIGRKGEVHFYMLMAAYYISGLFQEMWRTMFGIEAGIDPKFHRLMSGFESMDVSFTRGLWQLGRKAVDAGLEEIFKTSKDEDVLEKLKATKKGKKWSAGVPRVPARTRVEGGPAACI